jgi:hypothetical protein
MWPSTETRENVRFVSDVLQAVAIIFTIIWAATTFRHQVATEAEDRRLALSGPYAEKQLDLYLDAARVVAHLATSPDSPDRAATETRFWELYWGELAFVESRSDGAGSNPSVESLMAAFCKGYFDPALCGHTEPKVDAAFKLSHLASLEIQQHWKEIGQPAQPK